MITLNHLGKTSKMDYLKHIWLILVFSGVKKWASKAVYSILVLTTFIRPVDSDLLFDKVYK